MPAQFNLAHMFGRGDGVVQSDSEGVKWLRKAADQGDADAQYLMGTKYTLDRGVARSDTEAAKWYKKAADQGHEKAMRASDINLEASCSTTKLDC
jgi:TPR repeat protein